MTRKRSRMPPPLSGITLIVGSGRILKPNSRVFVSCAVQKHGGPQIRQHAKTSPVGDAEARHEGTARASRADHQGHDPGSETRAGRHGDGQGPAAEPQQQGAERAALVAHQPGHRDHAEDGPGCRRRLVGQGVVRLRGQ